MTQIIDSFIDDNQKIPVRIEINSRENKINCTAKIDFSLSRREKFRNNIISELDFECHITDKVLKNNDFISYDNDVISSQLQFNDDLANTATIAIKFRNHSLIKLKFTNNQWQEINHHINRLSSAECKMIGRYSHKNILPYSRNELLKITNSDNSTAYYGFLTDLHTHLSSQISSSDLLLAAKKANAKYPSGMLEMFGLDCSNLPKTTMESYEFKPAASQNNDFEQAGNIVEAVYVADILANTTLTQQMQSLLELPFDNVSNFDDVEYHMYRARNPLNKTPALVPYIIEQVAKDYKKQGVEYAELSVTAVLDEKWLSAAIIAIEKAEQETGVKLRLLASLFRDESPHNMLIKLEKIKFISQCPYIVGIDFLGYEANKTKNFRWALNNISRFAKSQAESKSYRGNDWAFADDFIIRVHAGENGKNKGNVAEALAVADKYQVRMRIGHAAHGNPEIDSKTINKERVIIEFNPDSNIALNNIDTLEQIPMKDWADSDVPFVIASDGGGAYLTNAKQLYKSAVFCGLTVDDISKIHQTEQKYIKYQDELFKNKQIAFNDKYNDFEGFIEDVKRFNAEILSSDKQQMSLSGLAGKTPILIAGASGTSWKDISEPWRKEIKTVINRLVNLTDAEKIYFVQGRVKDTGLGAVLDKSIEEYNDKQSEQSQKFDVLGMLSSKEQTPKLSANIDYITTFDKKYEQIAGEIIPYIAKFGGYAFFIGGSHFTREFINLCEDYIAGKYMLMNGPSGASTEKSQVTDNKIIIFKNAEEMMEKLRENDEFSKLMK